MAFYKKQGEELLVSEFVDGQGYMLSEVSKGEHVYPVDGWYWFDSLDSAIVGLANTTPSNSLTPLQAKLQLHRVGLLDEVEAMAATDMEVKLYWEYALEIRRDHPTLLSMATALGLSDTQLDEMFIEAGKIQ